MALERRTDQLVARAPGRRFRLPVDVGDGAARIGGCHGVDVGFEERARIEVLVAQPLVELLVLAHAVEAHVLRQPDVGLHRLVGRCAASGRFPATSRPW
jgi:hypothetical protein